MSRMTSLQSPFLLGFDDLERALDRVTKGADGYPPYNIERLAHSDCQPDRLRITLAVAGFGQDQIDVTIEKNELIIRGRQPSESDGGRVFLHRGIAARQFTRAFVLAEGMEVLGADLAKGLLVVDLVRPEPKSSVQRIAIRAEDESRRVAEKE